MKTRIESQGRITLPAKLLMEMGLKEGDTLYIDHSEEGILLIPKQAIPFNNTDSLLVYQNHVGDARVLTMK